MQQRTTTTTLPLGPNLESSWDCLDPSPAPGGRKMNDLKAGEPPGDISAPSLEDGKIIKIEPNPSFLSGSIYYIYIHIYLPGCKKNHTKFYCSSQLLCFRNNLYYYPPPFSDAKTLQQSSWNKLSSDDLENYAKYLVSSATVT